MGMYSGAAALAVTTNFQQSQDTLYALASDTGGKALLDYNDLTKGIVEAERSVSSYYILGYYTTNTTQDGKFRRIKISLSANVEAKLDYRQGYFAGKEFSKFTAADKERQLEDALMLPDPVTELTIAMEVDYFQLNRAEYFVPIVVKIPGRELALAKRGGAERTLIDFIGEIKDDYGTTITNVRDKVNVKLNDATAIELTKRPIEYDAGFTLLPGKYSIKFLARDAETGRIGTYQAAFVVPNLNKEEKRLPISSVVLSSQRVDLKDALYNAVKDKDKTEAANPLVQRGQKLIPSVTRVFTKNREMYVYLQAYEQTSPAIQPLVAFVSFYRGQKKAFETQAIEVKQGINDRLKTMPIQFSIALNNLAPGKYDCQVTVLTRWDRRLHFGGLQSWLCRSEDLPIRCRKPSRNRSATGSESFPEISNLDFIPFQQLTPTFSFHLHALLFSSKQMNVAQQLPSSVRAALAGAALEALRALLKDADTPADVRLRAIKMVLAPPADDDPGPSGENAIALVQPAAARPAAARRKLLFMPRRAA